MTGEQMDATVHKIGHIPVIQLGEGMALRRVGMDGALVDTVFCEAFGRGPTVDKGIQAAFERKQQRADDTAATTIVDEQD